MCIDTNDGLYRYKPFDQRSNMKIWPMYRYKHVCVSIHISYIYQFLEILTDMYQIMQAWFDTSSTNWFSEGHRCVSIHAGMIRYTYDLLPLRNHFCIDTSDICIDTNCTKSVWSNFRTFVSIHMFMYRYIIPKNQFFKVLNRVFRC